MSEPPSSSARPGLPLDVGDTEAGWGPAAPAAGAQASLASGSGLVPAQDADGGPDAVESAPGEAAHGGDAAQDPTESDNGTPTTVSSPVFTDAPSTPVFHVIVTDSFLRSAPSLDQITITDAPHSPSVGHSTAIAPRTLNERPSASTLGGRSFVSTVDEKRALWLGAGGSKTSVDDVAGALPIAHRLAMVRRQIWPRLWFRVILALVALIIALVVIIVPAVLVPQQRSASAAAPSSTAAYVAPPAAATSSAGILPTSVARRAPIPDLVADLYTVGALPRCLHTLDTLNTSFGANGDGQSNAHYCGDAPRPADLPPFNASLNSLSTPISNASSSVIWWRSNMDVDCDGADQGGPCMNDPTFYKDTAFQVNGSSLNALSMPYVVMNQGSSFDPFDFGMIGLEVVGVVCNDSLTWAVWGDSNPANLIGEASYDVAQTCFPHAHMSGDRGWQPADVLYFAFPGVIRPDAGANYTALAEAGNAAIAARFPQALASVNAPSAARRRRSRQLR